MNLFLSSGLYKDLFLLFASSFFQQGALTANYSTGFPHSSLEEIKRKYLRNKDFDTYIDICSQCLNHNLNNSDDLIFFLPFENCLTQDRLNWKYSIAITILITQKIFGAWKLKFSYSLINLMAFSWLYKNRYRILYKKFSCHYPNK